MPARESARIHPTAEVASSARVGGGSSVWNRAQIREEARVGAECVVGSNVYIDVGVSVGDRVKIENNACLFRGATVEDGAFIGPGVLLLNDRYPRAVNPDGSLQTAQDWTPLSVRIGQGASVGAGSIVLAGVTVGRSALIGAGSVATRDIPAFGFVVGSPARLVGAACCCGHVVRSEREEITRFTCESCHRTHVVGEDRA